MMTKFSQSNTLKLNMKYFELERLEIVFSSATTHNVLVLFTTFEFFFLQCGCSYDL